VKWLTLNEIVAQTGGVCVQGKGNPLIKNVVTKRYKIGHHTLLIDLYTKRKVDSKLFKKYNEVVVMTEKPHHFTHLGEKVMVVQVDNIDETYWNFIDYYRNLFDIPIIGITGTCGKTTTKEMITHILKKRYKVQSTYKSFNGGHRNHRYLLGIDEDTGAAVIEMGVDRPGDILFYLQYFRPQIRVLLNIDVYHLVGCKTPERYLKAKAELLHDFDPNYNTLILNADDENIRQIDVSHIQNNIVYFGMRDGCHFQATDVSYEKKGMKFTLHHQHQTYSVYVPGYGKHNVYNALASIAATCSAGVEIKEACERLASFQPVMEHLEFREGINGSTIIDDTWNVTPLSMETALQVLKEVADTKNKIALLGYMPQLGEGEYAKNEYERIGRKVMESNVDYLIVVGEEAKEIAKEALKCGMNPTNVYFAEDGTDILDILEPLLSNETIVLLKIPHRVMVQDSFKQLKSTIIES
jgi:UDP-N-acetylmuramoyl-tripeptide--D-alanyl-D-alanine ligase